jgi:hypothetical protein
VLIENLLWKSIIRREITNDFLLDICVIVSFFFAFHCFFNFNENTESLSKSIAEIFFVNIILKQFKHLFFNYFKFKETVDAWSLFRIFVQ